MGLTCVRCEKDLGAGGASDANAGDLVRDLCDECRNFVFTQREVPLRDYIDGIDKPVVLVGDDVDVVMANRTALRLLGKRLPNVVGLRGGDVLECAYAKLTEGCGRTIHCSGCTIRRAVTDTFETGKDHQYAVAVLHQGTVDATEHLRFLISTRKVLDMVVLRIDSDFTPFTPGTDVVVEH